MSGQREINFAELQQRIDSGNVTLEECRRMGATHHAYGWSAHPPVVWSQEQRDMYLIGYSEAHVLNVRRTISKRDLSDRD